MIKSWMELEDPYHYRIDALWVAILQLWRPAENGTAQALPPPDHSTTLGHALADTRSEV